MRLRPLVAVWFKFGNKTQNQSQLSIRNNGVLVLPLYALSTQIVVNFLGKEKYFKIFCSDFFFFSQGS